MNENKQSKGITLVALVVTIVVLLILAGVSINMVVGDNGIITKAKEAVEKTARAQENAEIEMNELAKQLESTIGEDTTKVKTLVQAFDDGDIKIGDYVDYKPVAGKTYTSVTNENGWADQTYTVDTNTTWRVLGKENGQILLISGNPIKKNMDTSSTNDWDKDPYLYMKGAYAYVNCVSMLNNICSIYSNNYGTARSITIEDINKVCGVKVEDNKVYLEADENKTNIDGYQIFGKTDTYTETDYTPESYINGKNHATIGEKVIANNYYYNIKSMRNIIVGNTTIGNLIADKVTDEENGSKAYWLASSGIYTQGEWGCFGPSRISGVVTLGIGLFYYNSGIWYAARFGVRPVIEVNENITLNNIKLLKNQNIIEETWSDYSTISFGANGDITNGEAGNHGN